MKAETSVTVALQAGSGDVHVSFKISETDPEGIERRGKELLVTCETIQTEYTCRLERYSYSRRKQGYPGTHLFAWFQPPAAVRLEGPAAWRGACAQLRANIVTWLQANGFRVYARP